MGIFEQTVEQDDEFAHDGGEGEFGRFTSLAEVLVEGLEDAVVDGCGESRHVKDPADGGAATMDVALSAVLAAVVVEGSDSREGGGFRVTQGAEFGKQREECEGGDAAYAVDLLESGGLGAKLLAAGEVCIEQGVDFRELPFELFLARMGELDQDGDPGVFPAINLIGDQANEFLSGTHQLGELDLALCRDRVRCRLHAAAVLPDDLRIQCIGLDQASASSGEVPDLPGVDGTDRHPRRVQRQDQIPLVRSGVLADDLDGTKRLSASDQLGVTLGVIGGGPALVRELNDQTKFRDIDSNIGKALLDRHGLLPLVRRADDLPAAALATVRVRPGCPAPILLAHGVKMLREPIDLTQGRQWRAVTRHCRSLARSSLLIASAPGQ